MRIDSVSIEVLETPVSLEYTAAGHDVASNWHVLARLRTDDGVEGVGWVVPTAAAWCGRWPPLPLNWATSWLVWMFSTTKPPTSA